MSQTGRPRSASVASSNHNNTSSSSDTSTMTGGLRDARRISLPTGSSRRGSRLANIAPPPPPNKRGPRFPVGTPPDSLLIDPTNPHDGSSASSTRSGSPQEAESPSAIPKRTTGSRLNYRSVDDTHSSNSASSSSGSSGEEKGPPIQSNDTGASLNAPLLPTQTTAPSKTKRVLKWIPAIVPAFMPGVYALMLPSGEQPSQISKAWWDAMNLLKKIASIVLLMASVIVNSIINKEYFPGAVKTFKKSKRSWTTAIAALIGILSAVAALALGYHGFEWMGGMTIPAIILGSINAAMYLVTRSVGTKNLLAKIYNARINWRKSRIANQLELVNETSSEVTAALNHVFTEGKTLTEDSVKEFITKLDTQSKIIDLEANDPQPLFREKTRKDYAKEGAEFLLSSTLFTAATGAFFSFDQLFLNGLKIMSRKVNDVNKDAQKAIGFIPGFGSFGLYASSALDFVDLMHEIAYYILNESDDPRGDFYKVLGVLAINAAACTSMYMVAQGVATNPDSAFSFDPESDSTTAYKFSNAIGGFITNTRPCLTLLFKDKFSAKDRTPTLSDIKRHLRFNSYKAETIAELRKLSIFSESTESGTNAFNSLNSQVAETPKGRSTKKSTR